MIPLSMVSNQYHLNKKTYYACYDIAIQSPLLTFHNKQLQTQ